MYIMNCLSLKSGFDHVQRKNRSPSDDTRNATTEKDLQGGLVCSLILSGHGALAKLIGPKAIPINC